MVVLDFETYFRRTNTEQDPSYTLSSMSTEAYIRDARFEAHGAAIKWSADTTAKWYDERQLRWVLQNEDWSDTFLVAHHCQFDGLILSHHYDCHPVRLGCTLSMARLLLGNHLSVSLDAVRKHFGIPTKLTPYHLFDGRHWNEITSDVQGLIAEGACDEVESIWKIFHLLMQNGFPAEELKVIDTTIKMFTEPCLVGDVPLLAEVWQSENKRKLDILAELNVTADQLQSSNKFAELLEAEGVEPEMKEGKNGEIYAFAKTDQFMRDLLEDESPRVRGLAEARIGQKSTLLQTRAETLGWAARRGPLPVYLRYAGAHTTRWSGGDGCLTADTWVLVFDYQKGLTEKRIVDIMPDDLIWDGEDFVAHGGVVFQGYQEVIEHDSIRGTRGHIVFDVSGKEISLVEAARMGKGLMDCPEPDRKKLANYRQRNTNKTRAGGSL